MSSSRDIDGDTVWEYSDRVYCESYGLGMMDVTSWS
jgi:hypothetical protein